MEKVAIVTGGTAGLGLELVKRLLEQGAYVVSMSRNAQRIEEVTAELSNERAVFLKGDTANPEDIHALVSYVREHFGHLDVLINNAGVMRGNGLADTDVETWEYMMRVNVTAPFLLAKECLPLLMEAARERTANILNVSSLAAFVTSASMPYSTTKAALNKMTNCWAAELGKSNIRVNSVNPSLFDTGLQVHNGLMDEEAYKQLVAGTDVTYPIGSGKTSDVADLVMFLISPQARWITGVNYIIDGGNYINGGNFVNKSLYKNK